MRILFPAMALLCCTVCLAKSLFAGPPKDAAALVRFFDQRTNEHCYSISESEQSRWRGLTPALKPQYAIGLVARSGLPGTKRLYRHLPNGNGRAIYAFSEKVGTQYTLDPTNFEAYVWSGPGDGRIPVYGSTWTDGTDLFLESNLALLEKYSENTKIQNGVTRLRPVDGPMFYVYPVVDQRLIAQQATQTAPTPTDSPAPSSDRSRVLSASPTTVASRAGSAPTATGKYDSESSAAVEEEILVEFENLPLDHPATSFDMTEDGRFLVISHQSEDRLSVYDVLQGKVVSSLKCVSPRSVLCRGNRVFVANYGRGTISVFDRGKQFRLVDRLQVEKPNIVHISAPMGDRFSNELIVTSHGEGHEASYRDSHIYVVDVRKDRFRRIGGEALASVSADGKLVITQGSFNLSPAGDIRAYSYKDFTSADGKHESLYGGGVSQTPYVYQVMPSNYWLSTRVILGGIPIGEALQAGSELVVPDYSQRLLYVINADVVKSHAIKAGFPYEEMRRARYPSQFKDFSKINQHHYRMCGYLLDHPTAYVHDGRLHMFVLTGEGGNGAMLRANTPAFRSPSESDSAEVPAKAENASSEAKPDEPGELTVEEELKKGFPAVIPAGRKFVHRWKLSTPGRFELMSPVANADVSVDGNLTWRVAEDQIGKHEFKLRITQGDETAIERLTVEVIDPGLAQVAGGDLSNLKDYQRLKLEPDNYFLSGTQKSGKMLLLQGDTLTLLAGNGFTVERKFELPKRYRYLYDRGTHLTALCTEDGFAVDIIDKVSMKVRHSIDLAKGRAKIDEVSDMAIDPAHPVSYVSIKSSSAMPQYNILRIDETVGSARSTEMFGTWVQVSRDGRQLFTGYSDIFRRGTTFHINPNWDIIDIPTYGNIDMLLCWDTENEGDLVQALRKPGTNGRGLRLSPDGRQVTYLSITGEPESRGDLIAWDTTDFSKPGVRYALKDRGSTTELVYHPWLPIVASPGSSSAVLFDQDSGELIENKLVLPSTGLDGEKIERLIFSADGRHLLFVCSGEEGRYIRSVDLRLEPSELSAKLRSPTAPREATHAARQAKPQFSLNQIHALQRGGRTQTLTPKEIGKRHLDAVVSIVTKTGGGSGFFVGKSGYLLTSAHVVENTAKVTVIHNENPGRPFKALESPAQVLCVDETLDIALLRITLRQPTPHVMLSTDAKVDTGEAVVVIGSPGLGRAVLDRTMTEGIVSNPERLIRGQPYIQTSAAVNPGNSGGPMFDSRGRVIGLVNLKAGIEGTGFATPASAIERFLRLAAGGN